MGNINPGMWQQVQHLEAGQGTLSGLSSQQAQEVLQLEQEGGPNGSSLTQAQLQQLLALLMQNQQAGQGQGQGCGQGTNSQSLGAHKIV